MSTTTAENQINGENVSESAVTRVLMVTELLELVLRRVPIHTILIARRTSKKWKAVIDGSPDLQKELFYTPDQSQAQLLHDNDTLAPLPPSQCSVKDSGSMIIKLAANLNPLIFDLFNATMALSERAPDFAPDNAKIKLKVHKDWASDNKTASYLKMYISNPPPTHVEIRSEGGKFSAHISNKHGINVGQVLAELSELYSTKGVVKYAVGCLEDARVQCRGFAMPNTHSAYVPQVFLTAADRAAVKVVDQVSPMEEEEQQDSSSSSSSSSKREVEEYSAGEEKDSYDPADYPEA